MQKRILIFATDINGTGQCGIIDKGQIPPIVFWCPCPKEIALEVISVFKAYNITISIDKLPDRKIKFAMKVNEFKDKYPDEMLEEFVRYWTESNSKGLKMRHEIGKENKVFDINLRLIRWFKTYKPSASNEHKIAGRQTEETVIKNIKGW